MREVPTTGSKRAAILCTMLQTAKLNALDPEAYFADVIDRIANRYPINRWAILAGGASPHMGNVTADASTLCSPDVLMASCTRSTRRLGR
jgi:hypothetical protein